MRQISRGYLVGCQTSAGSLSFSVFAHVCAREQERGRMEAGISLFLFVYVVCARARAQEGTAG